MPEPCATGLCLLRHNEPGGYRPCKCARRGQGTRRVRSGFHCRLHCGAVALPEDNTGFFVTIQEEDLVYDLMAHFGACQTAWRLRSCTCLGQRQLHLSNDAVANVQVLVRCPAALVADGSCLSCLSHVLLLFVANSASCATHASHQSQKLMARAKRCREGVAFSERGANS